MRVVVLSLFCVACSTNANAPELGGSDALNGQAGTPDGGVAPADTGAPPLSVPDAGPTQVPPEDPPDCEVDSDCPEGDVCRSGECRALFHGCASSADCHEGAVCSTQNGVCVETCSEDSDCPTNTRCSNIRMCLQECDMDAGDAACPEGTVCKENRRTASFPFCGLEEEGVRCGPGGTCPAGMGCNPDTGRCDSEHACVSDRDCPSDSLCNRATGRCHAANGACGNDRDCPEEQICHRVLRRCAPPGYCETHHECPGREQCHPILERCLNRCQNDRHCPDDQYCRESWCVEE